MQVSIPYWNGLDYRKKIDIPEMLRNPESSQTPLLDKFFVETTGERFGFMNFQNQWYQYSPRKKIPEHNNMFSDYWYGNQRDIEYPEEIKRILEDDYNLKENPRDLQFQVDRNSQSRVYPTNIPLAYFIAPKRAYETSRDFMKMENGIIEGKATLNQLNSNETNYIFGGKGLSYFNLEDQERFDDQSILVKLYNDSLAYFNYAFSLLCPAEKYARNQRRGASFLTPSYSAFFSFETPHNKYHNDLQFPMYDGSFSVLNPLFFIYHTMIDFMLEIKIRMIENNYFFDRK